MNKNNYIFDKTFKKVRTELVFPSYKAFHGDIGFYWDIGISLSIGGAARIVLHIGLLFGWFKIILYK